MIEVRVSSEEDNGTVTKYTGYKYFRVEDKNGDFLFGFHVSSESDDDIDIFFVLPKVTIDKKSDRIIVRSTL